MSDETINIAIDPHEWMDLGTMACLLANVSLFDARGRLVNAHYHAVEAMVANRFVEHGTHYHGDRCDRYRLGSGQDLGLVRAAFRLAVMGDARGVVVAK